MLYKRALLTASAAMLVLCCAACEKKDNIIQSDNPQVALIVPDGDDSASEGSDGPTEAEKATIKLGLLKGADSIVAAHMMSGSEAGSTYENYDCKLYNDDDEIVEAFKSGEIMAAILPANKAAQLYNATGGTAKSAVVCTKCNYYIADTNGSVKSIDSLAGQTVYIPKNDELAELMLNILLEKNNITTCKIEYKDNNDELVAALADGQAQVALMQEPFLSEAVAKNSGINVALDLYDTWNDTTGTELATGCLVVNSGNITGSTLKYFTKDLEASVNMTKHNMDETATLAEKYGMVSSAAVAKASIPGCSISNTDGDKMKTSLQELFVLLYDADDESLGGNVPEADFYLTSK